MTTIQSVTPLRKSNHTTPLARGNGLKTVKVLTRHIEAVIEFIKANPGRNPAQISRGVEAASPKNANNRSLSSVSRATVNAILDAHEGANALVRANLVLPCNLSGIGRQPQWFKNLPADQQAFLMAQPPFVEGNYRPSALNNEFGAKYDEHVNATLSVLRSASISPRTINKAIKSLTLNAGGYFQAAQADAQSIIALQAEKSILLKALDDTQKRLDENRALLSSLNSGNTSGNSGSPAPALAAPAV